MYVSYRVITQTDGGCFISRGEDKKHIGNKFRCPAMLDVSKNTSYFGLMSDWKKALMVATKDGFLGPFFLDLDVLELLPFAADVDDSLPFCR